MGKATVYLHYETHTEVRTHENGKETVKIYKPPLPLPQLKGGPISILTGGNLRKNHEQKK